MTRDWEDRERAAKAHAVFVRLALPPYTIHFKSPAYMQETTLDLLDKRVCKETLKSTATNASVRRSIGTDVKFWTEIVVLFKAAVPSLERRSFSIWDPSSVDYESTSGALIASHYPGLWKDLERLNDLVSIGRNVLTLGKEAQDMSAEYHVDSEIFRLINCCVRVTARGYDGEAGTGEEEKWQLIVNAYKKLLITSLQFLNNMVAQNEKKKLKLWISLFDHGSFGPDSSYSPQPEDAPQTAVQSLTDMPSNPLDRPLPPLMARDLYLAFGTDGRHTIPQEELDAAHAIDRLNFVDTLPQDAIDGRERLLRQEKLDCIGGNGYALFMMLHRHYIFEDYRSALGRDPTDAEIYLASYSLWPPQEEEKISWQRRYDDAVARFSQNFEVWRAKRLIHAPYDMAELSRKVIDEQMDVDLGEVMSQKFQTLQANTANKSEDSKSSQQELPSGTSDRNSVSGAAPIPTSEDTTSWSDERYMLPRATVEADMRMLFTANAGKKILESGKAELMKRLEGYDAPPPPPPPEEDEETQKLRLSVEAIRRGDFARPKSPAAAARQQERIEATVRLAQERGIVPSAPDQTNEEDGSDTMDEDGDEEEGLEDLEDKEDEDDEESEEDEEDEDYPGSTEDGRGLLTDVPLILGPSEIEVLPMLIMSGIVPPPPDAAGHPKDLDKDERNHLANMHTVRTHLLLAQSNGRNLLRELLIFVAAWDLREEELYFKFMVKIMEAILKNGLMPYAYHAFRDRSRSKDIISPAQAVIMKLLTCIFRARGEGSKYSSANTSAADRRLKRGQYAQTLPPAPSNELPNRVDLHIMNFIFTEFRQHIIPQTCALIFLQGQIHHGRASPEDFPLNLWDMERMYEGVYQYLEFFAVLSEEALWKDILGQWEMASELVTLLFELEGGIPKMPAAAEVAQPQQATVVPVRQKVQVPVDAKPRSMSTDAAMPSQSDAQAAMHHTSDPPTTNEQAFDAAGGSQSHSQPPPAVKGHNVISEPETPLAYPEDGSGALPPDMMHGGADQDEPSDFEWRNLKKLTVLVLSSLIWKNRAVQDQVRKYGGLHALIACCRADEHNPYIREHAIMCLRFAVEGCDENAEVIRRIAGLNKQRQQQLEAGQAATRNADYGSVPSEVLDTQGYETFMDPKGQVGLRKKDGQPAHPYAPVLTGQGSAPTAASQQSKDKARLAATKMTAEKAAELMQNALRDLPLGDKLVTDRQKADALAKLDKAFASTEQAPGRGHGQGPTGSGPSAGP